MDPDDIAATALGVVQPRSENSFEHRSTELVSDSLDETTPRSVTLALPPDFEKFLETYPRSSSKIVPLQAWRQTRFYHPPDFMARVRRFSNLWRLRTQKEGRQAIKYCPEPATWLRDHGWEGEEAAPPPGPSPAKIVQQESIKHYADPGWREYKALVSAGELRPGFAAWKEGERASPETVPLEQDLTAHPESTYEIFLEQIDRIESCNQNLDDFIQCAAQYHHLHQRPEDSEAMTQQGYRGPLWTLFRCLHRHEMLSAYDPVEVWEEVKNSVERITNGSPDEYWGQFGFHFAPLNSDDAETEFFATWAEIEHPIGLDSLNRAALMAREYPSLSAALGLDSARRYSRFLDIAYHLQLDRYDMPVILDQRRLGIALGCTQRQVSNLCKMGRDAEIISQAALGDWSQGLSGEYWVNMGLVDPGLLAPENFYHDSHGSHDYQDSYDLAEQHK